MSELIAEARVLVTPDTTTFRALLTTELNAISRTIPPVPVSVVPTVTTTAVSAVTAQQLAGANAARASAEALAVETAARRQAAKAAAEHSREMSQLSRGAAAAALSFTGLRGATLAATGRFLAGTVAVTALAKSLQLATSFASEIAVLGATTDATAQQLEVAAEAARRFGRDITLPGVSAGDAAKTITEFSKAGLSLNESIAATRGGLQLAQAAQLSYQDAVELTANALNAFNLSGSQAVRVADTLANAANLSQGNIADVGLALRQAAGAAQVVGVSFEDTIALLTQLAQNGLTGSDAGTALRTSFIRLVNPSKEAKDILADLNVELRDLEGNVRPEVFEEFAAAQRDLSVAQQQANAAVVFGQDAFRVIGILGQEAPGSLRRVQDGLAKTGTAARIAGARMTGLRGSVENLSNQLGTLGATIGERTTPFIESLVDRLAEFVSGANDAADAAGDLERALDRLPGSETAQGFVEEIAKGFLTDPIRFFAPITELAEEADDAADDMLSAGAELRSAIEDAGREAARGAVTFADQITGAVDAAFARVRTAIAQARRGIRAAQISAVGRGEGQAAGLDEQFDAILAGGGSLQQQIAALQRQARVQAKIIENAGPNAAGVLLEARRRARARLAAINQQIDAIERQIAADQKAALDAARSVQEQARRERDRAFLQAQEDARTRQERRITLAEDTPQLTDDIRRQQQLRELIKRQIEALKASALDESVRQDAIRTLVAAKFATTVEIKRLAAAVREERSEQRVAAAELNFSTQELLAQLTESDKDNERVLRAQIRFFASEARRLGVATNAGKEMRNRALEFVVQLRELLKARAEAADELEGAQGTSVADLLRENARIFSQSAGNVIGGDQPFDSPAAFSSSLARFLTPVSGKPQIEVVAKRDPATSAIDRQIQKLIDALNLNTAALGGGGPASGKGTDIQVRRDKALKSFYESTVARDRLDARRSGV